MAASMTALLRFCAFLSRRVHCDNVALLERIVREFSGAAQSFGTVDTMRRIGFPLVAILPVPLEDTARADEALDRMRSRFPTHAERHALRRLRVAIEGRIALRRWDWLEKMYDEFLDGHETSVKKFIALSPGAITVMPVEPSDKPRCHVKKEWTEDERVESEEEHAASEEEEEATWKEPQPVFNFWRGRAATLERPVLARISAAFHKVEKTEPWRQVFDVRRIQYPFDAARYPIQAKSFRQFWQKHARAVWERRFWCQYDETHDKKRYLERKMRQRSATEAFSSLVVEPLFDTFGARFFLDLDSRPEGRHEWWWYRRPLMSLTGMASFEGLNGCLRYIKKGATARFPSGGRPYEMNSNFHFRGSRSMWLATQPTAHIREAIQKRTRKRKLKRSEEEASEERHRASR